jgi:predicted O-linked N-acetylglucosamine transferase (SPINDLY family)
MNDIGVRIRQLIAQGVAAQNAQRFGEAERAYRTALQLDGTNPEALTLLGTLAGIAGRFQMAVDLFLRALERDSGNADIYHNLGETYRQLGDTGKALPAFNRAIELRPGHLEAYRSAADTAIAEMEKAAASSRTENAKELRRIAARYLFQLGLKQRAQHMAVVEKTMREALALDPDNADVLSALGWILQEKNRPTEAAAILRRALELRPNDAQAYNNLGNAYALLQRWPEMEAAFRQAVALDPTSTLPRANLDSTSLMRWLYDDSVTPQDIYDRHRAWAQDVTVGLSAAEKALPFANSADPDRRLRVAYLSGDFRYHSIAYFLHPLLSHHDPAGFEVFCYSDVEHPDPMTERLRRYSANWRDSSKWSDMELRAQLRADAIDIAIDLAGHTSKNRLRALAVRAAPVVATWLGYPGTTGLTTIDWRITDALADPPGAERFYTEKLMRLDDGFLCYEALGDDVPAVAPAPALTAGYVTFGCFNAPQKISPSTVRTWAAILAALPRSRLLMKGPALADPGLQNHFRKLFEAGGIDWDRVELREFAPTAAAHLRTYGEIDIALDPFPYNGTTTTCEAMWMGVPVVSLIGDRHAGRVGFDLLTRIGLPELAAPTTDAYVATAVSLAQDRDQLDRHRRTLRERMRASPLCNASRFTASFEQALRKRWADWCASL